MEGGGGARVTFTGELAASAASLELVTTTGVRTGERLTLLRLTRRGVRDAGTGVLGVREDTAAAADAMAITATANASSKAPFLRDLIVSLRTAAGQSVTII